MSPARYHLVMHLVVLIYGFTGILGELITVDSFQLVWHRMSIAALGIAAFLLYRGIPFGAGRGDAFRMLGIGFLIALHWIAFFSAINASNVSVTLGCMASASLFTAFLEPLFFKKRVRLYEVVLGMMVIGGLWTIFRYEAHYATGIGLALLASFSAALFTVINARMIRDRGAAIISFYEMIGGTIGISLFFLISGKELGSLFRMPLSDYSYLLVLGLICTAFAFMASVHVMKVLNPFSVSLTINLEPVYGIILAFLFFGEEEKMSLGFYLGTSMILAALFTDAWMKRASGNSSQGPPDLSS
ncbi:MAG: DMT family transporter [Flavobacteriales bacterium]